MSADADIVLLSQESADNSGANGASGSVSLRVVLHRKERRVYVEAADGVDAIGVPRWRRIDPRKPASERRKKKSRPPTRKEQAIADNRRAHEAVERITATLYERATAAEARALAAEARAAQAELRSQNRGPPMRFPNVATVLPAPDPHAPLKQKLANLLELAVEPRTPAEEARNAAMAAARLVVSHPEIIK